MEQESEFEPTMGALGNGKGSRKKSKKSGKSKRSKRSRTEEDGGGSSSKKSRGVQKITGDTIAGLTQAPKNQKSAASDASLPEAFNLAGRPDILMRTSGIKKHTTRTFSCRRVGNLAAEPVLYFTVRSSKNEFVRFSSTSLSLVVYGTYNNPARRRVDAIGANPENTAEVHALRARLGQPRLWLDPSIMGTSFIDKVEVTVDNVPVPTNSCTGQYLQHYVRCCRVMNARPGPHFTKTSQWAYPLGGQLSEPLRVGSSPFHYNAWDSTMGIRVPVYLDGVFPFSFKNRTQESIEKVKQPNLFFPPDTTFEFKVTMRRSKMEALFNNEINALNYFDRDAVVGLLDNNIRFTFQEATVQVESAELTPALHIDTMTKFFSDKGRAHYDYSIPRIQKQSLAAGQSFTENSFQVLPYARIAYVLFVVDHQVTVMEHTRRPLSGFSRFPANCTKLSVGFQGDNKLITESFERFGFSGETSQITKAIYYQYLKDNHMTADAFGDFFPLDPDDTALNQLFCLELKNHMSANTENLVVQCEFAAGATSPEHLQILLITVHPNGLAICRSGSTNYSWIWEFSPSG